ncbi:MAG: response regulator [Desulfobacterales bacterium]
MAKYSSTKRWGGIFVMKTKKNEKEQRQPVIIFADDDAICLDVGIRMLRKLGYMVLDAKDGKEAIEVFLNNQGEVDLVILDMKMPYNGGTAFSQLQKINANVKVIIASGYAEDQQIREMMKKGCSGFIQKPFSIDVLSHKIMNALKR